MRTDISGWTTRLGEQDIARYTHSGAWRNVTLADCARALAQHSPGRIAVVEGERSATFGDVYAQAARLAGAFGALGLTPGAVISLQLPNWIETLTINLAACMAGLVVNPIVPIYREAEVGYILKDARARLFLIPQTFRGFDYPAMARRLRQDLPDLLEVVALRGSAAGCLSYDALLERAGSASAAPVAPDPNAVKLVLYTSGTT